MIKKNKEIIDLPLEEGKTYKTKFATGEHFTIKTIVKDKTGKAIRLQGIFEHSPNLGECPLNVDRVIPDSVPTGNFIEVCDNCGEKIHE